MFIFVCYPFSKVLLDSLKRKAYDDELRREDLLNCFRRFQSASQKVNLELYYPCLLLQSIWIP